MSPTLSSMLSTQGWVAMGLQLLRLPQKWDMDGDYLGHGTRVGGGLVMALLHGMELVMLWPLGGLMGSIPWR